MPVSVRQSGFTLIEMLVVLLIMGIFVGLVSTITQPDDRAMLQLEAQRLARLLDLAATKSRLTGRPTAWTADARGYRFWQFTEDAFWTEILDDDTLRARALPQDMAIVRLEVENRKPSDQMRLEFTPYAQPVSFSVQMALGEARETVVGSPIGDVWVLSQERTTNEPVVRR